MGLIDANELLKEIEETAQSVTNARSEENIKKAFLQCLAVVREDIIRRKTAYDVDAVVEQLEEEKKRAFELCLATNDSIQRLKYIEKEQTIALAIEIVKGGGVDAKTNS